MGFISENLIKDETVIHQGKLHKVIYMPAAAAGLWGLILIFGVPVLGTLLILLAGYLAFQAWMRETTTEIALTNKRLLGKTGFIKRDTIDLNLKKVESLYADQDLLGRMWNYGSIRVVGTGGSSFIVKGIDDPVAFKRAASSEIDAAQA